MQSLLEFDTSFFVSLGGAGDQGAGSHPLLDGCKAILPLKNRAIPMVTRDGRWIWVIKEDRETAAKRRLGRKLDLNFSLNDGLKKAWRDGATFWTLTYGPAEYAHRTQFDCGADFRVFMNRIKNTLKLKGMSYFAVVERGSLNGRLHIHFCTNEPFIDREKIKKLWRYGMVWVAKIRDKIVKMGPGKYKHVSTLDQVRYYITKYVKKHARKGQDEPRAYGASEDPNLPTQVKDNRGKLIFTSRDFWSVEKDHNAVPVGFLENEGGERIEDEEEKIQVKFVDHALRALALEDRGGEEYSRYVEACERFVSNGLQIVSEKVKKSWKKARKSAYFKWRGAVLEELSLRGSYSFKRRKWRDQIGPMYRNLVSEGLLEGFEKLVWRKVFRSVQSNFRQDLSKEKSGFERIKIKKTVGFLSGGMTMIGVSRYFTEKKYRTDQKKIWRKIKIKYE